MVITINKEDITDAQYGNLVTYLEGQGMKFQRVPIPFGTNVVGLVLGRDSVSMCKVCKGSGRVVMVKLDDPLDVSDHTCFECNGTGQVGEMEGKEVGTDGSEGGGDV